MKSNGERFEEAYNKIDALLRRKINTDRGISFCQVVATASSGDATVRFYKVDLLEYADLRNAIVHERGHAPFLIADPRNDAVRRIEEIWQRLSKPMTLRSIRRAEIRLFSVENALPEALAYMRKNDFSQIIIKSATKFVILSTEGIAHWLERKATEDIISLVETKLSQVLDFEPKDTCFYLSARDTIDEAREKLTRAVDKRVVSALITETGRPSEKPINIITPWDFVVGALRADPRSADS
jgi:predicted transcriptional regulator